MNPELSQKIVAQIEHLNKPLYCTISTVDESGLPWGAPVYFAYDENGVLFWTSAINAQHSLNIAHGRSAFISLFKEGLEWGTSDTYGLYLQGVAVELVELEEVAYARTLLCDRVGIESTFPESFLGDTPRRVYKFIPEKVWTNESRLIRVADGGGHMCDGRVEL